MKIANSSNLTIVFYPLSNFGQALCIRSCHENLILTRKVHVPNFGGLSGSEDRGGGDNSIQFINFRRVDDKSFKEWRQKVGGWKGG